VLTPGASMRAVVWTRYGPAEGLVLTEVPRPVPNDRQVLVKVRAATVTAGDCELRSLRGPLGFRVLVRLLMGPIRPRRQILGQELAGDVEAVGRSVTELRVGDRVFGTTGFGFGAYAEYVCLSPGAMGTVVTRMPINMSYDEAATVPTGGLEAFGLLRRAPGLAGRRVLIVGAAGGIGSFAVQLAKHAGAEVSGVDSGPKLELVRALGADHLIDFLNEDFTKGSERYDVIFDAVGKSRWAGCLDSLRPGGCYLVGNPDLRARLGGLRRSRSHGRRVMIGPSSRSIDDLN
jgi:NADPH:quinone reductase-like Zn-dependent oxidoreductase